ncbi:MAG: hypothetical protein ACTSXQ_00165 [Alphaproteobacteria bacterium]
MSTQSLTEIENKIVKCKKNRLVSGLYILAAIAGAIAWIAEKGADLVEPTLAAPMAGTAVIITIGAWARSFMDIPASEQTQKQALKKFYAEDIKAPPKKGFREFLPIFDGTGFTALINKISSK